MGETGTAESSQAKSYHSDRRRFRRRHEPPFCYIAGMDWKPLVDAARAARERAYAPYSGYRVGAALLAADGSIHAAGNVENGIPALGVCAERAAVAAAVSAGAREWKALAVVTASTPPARPCGVCRQTLAELAGDELPILCVNAGGEAEETTLGELLPSAFRFRELREDGGGA